MQPDGYRWDTLPNVSTRAKLRPHPLQNIQITNLLGDNENWYWESEPDVDWYKIEGLKEDHIRSPAPAGRRHSYTL